MATVPAFLGAAAVAFALGHASSAIAGTLPAGIVRQLPEGYSVLTSAAGSSDPAHIFYVVALASRTEAKRRASRAPARPLLIYRRQSNGQYVLAGRNDDVVLRADDGGFNGCDPFEARRIAAKGRYFTVENGVACGAHWTDYVTFRFDPRTQGYVFDNRRVQCWSMNPSNRADAEALISDGEQVIRPAKGKQAFSQWRRRG